MKADLIAAFDSVSDGYSIDRVIADPAMNLAFLEKCRQLGLNASASQLNQKLLNLRKSSSLAGRPRSKVTRFRDSDEYRFAAEMAIRFMERKHGLSLDQIMCSPDLASEFDCLAQEICPGYSALAYRWAAFGLRKAKKLLPETAARLVVPDQVFRFPAAELAVNDVPDEQGLYVFFDRSNVLYIGEAQSLRKRIKKHLDHSDNKGFARWMWQYGPDDLHLELQVFSAISVRMRKALELELIRSRGSVFNVKR